MRYFLCILLFAVASCQSPTDSTNHLQADVKYFGSSEYEGTYQFKVLESEDIRYSVIEIDTGDFTPKANNKYCMNLELIEVRDYRLVSFCD